MWKNRVTVGYRSETSDIKITTIIRQIFICLLNCSLILHPRIMYEDLKIYERREEHNATKVTEKYNALKKSILWEGRKSAS